MKDKDWLDKVALGARVYNEGRLHGDLQSDEVLKFVEWLHRQYGVVYSKSEPTAKTIDRK
jgi:hypothetical protein